MTHIQIRGLAFLRLGVTLLPKWQRGENMFLVFLYRLKILHLCSEEQKNVMQKFIESDQDLFMELE